MVVAQLGDRQRLAPEAVDVPALQGQAKMGALFSGFVGLAALALGRALGFGPARGRAKAGDDREPATLI